MSMEKNKQRTLVNRRIRVEQVVRLAHVFLDIAAHELPRLACEERKADLAFGPADQHRVAHGGHVEADFHERAVRDVRAEQRLKAFSRRTLLVTRLQVEALLVRERLRENPAVAADRRYPDVAQRP